MSENIVDNKKEKRMDTREQIEMSNLVVNSLKAAMLGKGKESQVDSLYEAFGYKFELNYKDYLRAYKRNGLAKRVIDATVDFTWKDFPDIKDEDDNANSKVKSSTPALNRLNKINRQRRREIIKNDDSEIMMEYTPFEEGVFELNKRFPLSSIFKKADKLNCIGRYSVIVIGTCVDDSEYDKINDLDKPLPEGLSVDELLYLNVYSEEQASIDKYINDQSDERYGLPEMYSITVNSNTGSNNNFRAHWSRVIHIAEDTLESDIHGTPKLESFFNNLLDVLKITGGAAEMFWLGAYQGLVFNVKDGYTLDEKSARDMTEQIENYTEKLQRFIKTKGVEVSTLSSGTADPSSNFDTQVKIISGASNVPVRILLGSEQGQLAASVDQDTFFSYITSRRNTFVTESIIKALLNRLMAHGYIPKATNDEYFIKWQPLFEQTKSEQIINANTLIQAAKAATPYGNTLDIITVEEVRGSLGLPEEIPPTNYDQFSMDEFDLSELNPTEETPAETGDTNLNKEVGSEREIDYGKYRFVGGYME